VDLGPSLVFVLLLLIELEILALSWAISNAPAHLISTPAWERPMLLDQTLEILISPFVYGVIVVVSLVIPLPAKD